MEQPREQFNFGGPGQSLSNSGISSSVDGNRRTRGLSTREGTPELSSLRNESRRRGFSSTRNESHPTKPSSTMDENPPAEHSSKRDENCWAEGEARVYHLQDTSDPGLFCWTSKVRGLEGRGEYWWRGERLLGQQGATPLGRSHRQQAGEDCGSRSRREWLGLGGAETLSQE